MTACAQVIIWIDLQLIVGTTGALLAIYLLHHNGRELPLFERKARRENLILAANIGWLHYSESFDDGIGLLKAADHMETIMALEWPPSTAHGYAGVPASEEGER
jgi:hypothetical protein